jgi:CrcB protein
MAGGFGAVARFVLDGFVRERTSMRFPWGTLVVNVSGSLILGFVTGLVLASAAPEELRLVAGTGFLGGYTTFSTASFETVRLVDQRQFRLALLYGVGTLLLTVCVATLGLCLGSRFT